MIKKVKINYPDLKLEREIELKKGINIIEQPNGWGKTIIANTIMSMYTGYFGRNKTIPNGFASIETDKGIFNLVKKEWIGSITLDSLARYSIVGSFFNDTKSTVEQRDILTKLLGIDYDTYIKEYLEKFISKLNPGELEYYSDLNLGIDKLKEKLKENNNIKGIIIEDITRLKGEILGFKEQSFEDVDKFYKDSEAIDKAKDEYNKTQSSNMDFNKNLQSKINSDNLKKNNISNELIRKKEQLEKLRVEYEENNSAVCFNCGSAMSVPEEKLKQIQEKGGMIKNEIKNLEAELDDLNAVVYDKEVSVKYLMDIKEVCEVLKLKLPTISEDRLEEYDNYNTSKSKLEIVKRELELKENKLKEINTIKTEDCIKVYEDGYKSFTEDLNTKVKETGLNIELFELLKNGNIRQTFNIYSDEGIEYTECSQGNKIIIQIKLALLFIKKFGFDFIIIDEAGIIGKDNFNLIKDLLKDYQVIFFKADKWK